MTSPRDDPARRVRLLVVDDDEDSRELIGRMLSDQGAIVSSAASAEEALRLLSENPRRTSSSATSACRTSDGYSSDPPRARACRAKRGGKTPAIALTAYARAEDGERALGAGFQAHVTKPVDPDRLIDVVSKLAGFSQEPEDGRRIDA